MLVIQFLQDGVELLAFSLDKSGSIAVLRSRGDSDWFDFDYAVRSGGGTITRRTPYAWARALQRAYADTKLTVRVTPAEDAPAALRAAAPRTPSSPEPDVEDEPLRQVQRHWQRRLLIALGALLVLAGGTAFGAWRQHDLRRGLNALIGTSPKAHKPTSISSACPPGASQSCDPPPAPDPKPAQYAQLPQITANAVAELAGSGGPGTVSFDYVHGIWETGTPPYWWQSALTLRTLVHYLQVTSNRQPAYQKLLLSVLSHNVRGKHPQFTNMFMDDTGWWGLALLDAANYELNIRGDQLDAGRFLELAEHDAQYISRQPRPCGGIAWQQHYPPDTIASAEFISLTAGLYRARVQPGPFYDPSKAGGWIAQAKSALSWLEQSHLLDPSGMVLDSLSRSCTGVLGGPLIYTEGEVADALVQLGQALDDHSYYGQAAAFINYTLGVNGQLIAHGVMRDRCEATPTHCTDAKSPFNLAPYKGIFVQAVSDWTQATGSTVYQGFLEQQARAIVKHAALDSYGRPGSCSTPSTCQLSMYWAFRPRPPLQAPTASSQAAAIDALTAALQLQSS